MPIEYHAVGIAMIVYGYTNPAILLAEVSFVDSSLYSISNIMTNREGGMLKGLEIFILL